MKELEKQFNDQFKEQTENKNNKIMLNKATKEAENLLKIFTIASPILSESSNTTVNTSNNQQQNPTSENNDNSQEITESSQNKNDNEITETDHPHEPVNQHSSSNSATDI